MVRCLFCQKIIERPKIYKGEIVQKFCSDECRWKHHNEIRREEITFAKEVISFLRKILKLKGGDKG